jgi:hypothetical protein
MSGTRVFPIEWHVTYWDYLGWADRLASPAHDDRQEVYAEKFGDGTYTPEMVVNAEEERASTDAGAVGAHIDAALGASVDVSTTVWLEGPMDDPTLQVGYAVTGAPAGTELWIVLVERDIFHDITAGENIGRTIEYDNAARSFVTVEPGLGTVSLDQIPDDCVRENAALVAFVQDPATMAVYGATDWNLTEAP